MERLTDITYCNWYVTVEKQVKKNHSRMVLALLISPQMNQWGLNHDLYRTFTSTNGIHRAAGPIRPSVPWCFSPATRSLDSSLDRSGAERKPAPGGHEQGGSWQCRNAGKVNSCGPSAALLWFLVISDLPRRRCSNCARLVLKLCSAGAQIVLGWCSNCARLVLKLCSAGAQIVLGWCSNCAWLVLKLCPAGAQIVPGWCSNCARLVLKLCLAGAQIVLSWCSNCAPLVLKLCSAGAQIVLGWCSNCARLVLELCSAGAQIVLGWCSNCAFLVVPLVLVLSSLWTFPCPG